MTLKDIQNKLYENLKPSGWGDKLKMFILSKEFYDILEKLYTDSRNDKKFTPIIKDLFRAFEECPYDKLKVVMVNQDPYFKIGVADGIAFSCSHTNKAEPNLEHILEEIEATVYPDQEDATDDVDLKRWSNQGVLMLNTALTCEAGKVSSHVDLWKPFIAYLFDLLNTHNTGIVYVFLGQKAKEWHTSIQNLNYKFFTTHPASALYPKKNKWNSGDVFNQINKVLEREFNTPIKW